MKNFLYHASLLLVTAVAALFFAGAIFIPLQIENGILGVVFTGGFMSVVYGIESIQYLGQVEGLDRINLFAGGTKVLHDVRGIAVVLWVVIYALTIFRHKIRADKAEQDAQVYSKRSRPSTVASNTQKSPPSLSHSGGDFSNGMVILGFITLVFVGFLFSKADLGRAARLEKEAVQRQADGREAAAMERAHQRDVAAKAEALNPMLRKVPEPEMELIPEGDAVLGTCKTPDCLSPPVDAEAAEDELPQRRVHLKAFELAPAEVMVGDVTPDRLVFSSFAEFVLETHYLTDAERNVGEVGCRTWGENGWVWQAGLSWRNPGFPQNELHPVVCVSQNDARAYTKWLSDKTGKHYRLPTENEWEYAARGGKASSRFWGDNPDAACEYANVADQTAKAKLLGFAQKNIHHCTDYYEYTAPFAEYKPNAYRLLNMQGNVWEWIAQEHIAKGGGWLSSPQYARAATRSNKEGACEMS